LNQHDLGRLSRGVSNKELMLAAHKVLTPTELYHIEKENKECTMDQNFAILMNWQAKTNKGLSTETIMEAFNEADSQMTAMDLEEVIPCNYF